MPNRTPRSIHSLLSASAAELLGLVAHICHGGDPNPGSRAPGPPYGVSESRSRSMLPSTPLTNAGESSVDRFRTSAIASVTATAVRHVVVVQQLEDADPQDGPVDGRHPVERPGLRSTS